MTAAEALRAITHNYIHWHTREAAQTQDFVMQQLGVSHAKMGSSLLCTRLSLNYFIRCWWETTVWWPKSTQSHLIDSGKNSLSFQDTPFFFSLLLLLIPLCDEPSWGKRSMKLSANEKWATDVRARWVQWVGKHWRHSVRADGDQPFSGLMASTLWEQPGLWAPFHAGFSYLLPWHPLLPALFSDRLLQSHRDESRGKARIRVCNHWEFHALESGNPKRPHSSHSSQGEKCLWPLKCLRLRAYGILLLTFSAQTFVLPCFLLSGALP